MCNMRWNYINERCEFYGVFRAAEPRHEISCVLYTLSFSVVVVVGNTISSVSARLIPLTSAVTAVFNLLCMRGLSRGLQRSLMGGLAKSSCCLPQVV